jgi:hypothetical protein
MRARAGSNVSYAACPTPRATTHRDRVPQLEARMICLPGCWCLLCQLAAPRELGVSSPRPDVMLDDGCSRASPKRGHDEYGRREADPNMHAAEQVLRRVHLKPRRKVVQTGRRKQTEPKKG